MLPVCVLFAMGIVTGWHVRPAVGWLLAALGILALLAWGHARWRIFWGMTLIYLAGWCHIVCRHHPWNPLDLRLLLGDEVAEVEVVGELVESPVSKPLAGGSESELATSAILEIQSLQRERRPPEPACGQIMVTVPEVLDQTFYAGRKVRVRGVLQRPPRAFVPYSFDYRSHLESRGIYYLLRVRRGEDWQLEGGGASQPPWPARFQLWARQALARGQPEVDEPVKLLWAMLLGWRGGLTDEVAEPFMKSGTMHLFAISGLHIGIVAYVLAAFGRTVGLSMLMARLVTLPLMWFYIAAAGWPASAVRAGIMLSVWWGGGLLLRPPQPLNSVCAAAVLILLWEPGQLFQAGFQLSFAVVLGLVLWAPGIGAWLERPTGPDRLALPSHTWLTRCWRLFKQRLVQTVAASFAAWLASAPLVLWHFSWVTPICVLANLVMVPLGFLTLVAGVAGLVSHALWPALGELFNHSAWGLMVLLLYCSEVFADWTFGNWAAARPVWEWLVMYGLLWLGVSVPGLTARWRAVGGAAMVAMVLIWAPVSKALHGSSVTVLPFDDGYSVLLREPGWAALVDTGRPGPARRVVAPFLHAQGLSRLDALIITHGDLGQMGGATFIESEFWPRKVLHGPQWHRSPAYRERLEHSPHRNLHQEVAAGFQLQTWRLLHPARGETTSAADDGVLVWRRLDESGACLLLSDLSRAGQNQLAQRLTASDIKADVLICGLPDQGEPLADGFLQWVQPKLVIVADHLYPATRRAPVTLGRRLARQGVALWCTRECGAVEIQFTKTGWRARAMDGRQAERTQLSGWHPPPSLESED